MTISQSYLMHLVAANYYESEDLTLGRSGDFITAPEISQTFGEMIASWTIAIWRSMGSPEKLILSEVGPGRGLLMRDLLFTAKIDKNFIEAIDLYLIDRSEKLKLEQKKQIDSLPFKVNVKWGRHLSDIPNDCPLILIANEFLDVLPTQTYKKHKKLWQERFFTKDKELWKNTKESRTNRLNARFPKAIKNDMVELSPSRSRWMMSLIRKLKKQGGAALLIDYGYLMPALAVGGDTLQAVSNHSKIKISGNMHKEAGQDITTHVDFMELSRIAKKSNIDAIRLQSQKEFLESCGINQRLENLIANCSEEDGETLKKGVARLTNEDQMGLLFKVLSVGHSLP